MVDKLEIFKKKILYRASYRGTKEMDILMLGFVRNIINRLTIEELEALMKKHSKGYVQICLKEVLFSEKIITV